MKELETELDPPGLPGSKTFYWDTQFMSLGFALVQGFSGPKSANTTDEPWIPMENNIQF